MRTASISCNGPQQSLERTQQLVVSQNLPFMRLPKMKLPLSRSTDLTFKSVGAAPIPS